LVIGGQSLTYALRDSIKQKFLSLALSCSSVICYRVSPLQKALVVQLVKKETNKICLSVGDGANDVSMIQVANVGVGIIGKEGTQAQRAADFSIPNFKSLKRLVSVHGRYSYLRMSELIYYSFYKVKTKKK
jgi:phospholipid-transporting ATPase